MNRWTPQPPKRRFIEEGNEHSWSEWTFSSGTQIISCDKCGLMRRRDGTSNPCKGVVKVALR